MDTPGNMDLEVRNLVEFRTRNQIIQSIVEWVNMRTPGAMLSTHQLQLHDRLYNFIPVPQYKTLEFLLAYLDKIFKTKVYDKTVDSGMEHMYPTVTFKAIIEQYTRDIMWVYDRS